MRYPQLYERIVQLTAIPESEWRKAEALAREEAFARGEHFLQPGDPPERFGLVMEGLFRAYRVSSRGEETVKAFRAEGQLIGPYVEMLQQIPSMTFIQALEASRVLVIHRAELEALERGHSCWTMVARRVAEYHFLLKERREQQFLDLSAQERLEQFWEEHPHLVGRIPQRVVAAYLGITPVALSRIVTRTRRRGGR